jgi:antitoxin component YwqK of YwqJK toxin-antitoxin module
MKKINLVLILVFAVSCKEKSDTVISYHNNGNVKKSIEMSDGMVSGKYKVFYETGSIKTIANYHQDTVHGVVSHFYENGNLQSRLEYDKGKQKLLTGYDKVTGQQLLYVERNGEKRNGRYFQINELGDTLVYANYVNDTLVYQKVVGQGDRIVDLFFDHKVTKIEKKDSVVLTFEILSPTEDIYTGVQIGQFVRGYKSELKNILISKGKKGKKVEVIIPRSYFMENDGKLDAELSELNSKGKTMLTAAFTVSLDRIEPQ